jgi:hypothetical protein
MEAARNRSAETIPIQCRIPRERLTKDPARWRVGSTEKALAATTGKKITPPNQTTSARNMRKRRKDIPRSYA